MIILDDINYGQMNQRTGSGEILANKIRRDDDSYKQSSGGVFEWLQVFRTNYKAPEILDKKKKSERASYRGQGKVLRIEVGEFLRDIRANVAGDLQ
ncbi:MAG: hypothetical protein EZS28_038170 [Streblomastix strix]|uniref:Uncharacterized protein n=1 Tax=Streblomastix strix TaxID=222440 RepID=A0A5J4U9D7_9EUKA|nr:MAG: hypothetical protein EZS28_038170 [Streblomastix strix]